MTNCLLVKQSQVNKPLQLTEHTGEGRGKLGAGRGLKRAEGMELGLLFSCFFSISLHTVHFVGDVCEMDCRKGIAI